MKPHSRSVFIAGPMSTSGEPGPNLNAAAVAAAELLLAGFFPFVPHVTWILHAIRPDVAVNTWQRWDEYWLRSCDAVLRLPGESRGADEECKLAERIGTPIFVWSGENFAIMIVQMKEFFDDAK